MSILKKIFGVLSCFLVLGILLAWFNGGSGLYRMYQATSPTTAPADYALQDDTLVDIPPFEPKKSTSYNPEKNLYWGDLHVHTEASFDAKLFGTNLTIEDAYRFTRGESLRSPGGESMQLSRPLDFVAITDHAEGFGMRTRCGDEGLTVVEKVNCWFLEKPNVITFQLLRGIAVQPGDSSNTEPDGSPSPAGIYQPEARRPSDISLLPLCKFGEGGVERCFRDSNADWAEYIELADLYYDPGTLTTFAAYEFSPSLPDSGKHHRNVIFNDTRQLPEHAISSLDVNNALELWRGLEETCTEPCDFLTIPHNMNKGWGLFYSRYTWDGKPYDIEDWRLRKRREPLAEMYQVKGASECALGVGATDEECAFSQILAPCEPGQKTGCAFQTGFARQGLKIGMELDQELGFNPLAFGMIAATDTHNASPGDVEEWDFVGKVGAISSPAIRRFRQIRDDIPPYNSTLQFHTSGGLAGVWAEENTREAIFAAMQRREAYATSGPRMMLRFFAGWGFAPSIINDAAPISVATSGGVPMGGVLQPEADQVESPTFFVWAAADTQSAPLQRVQMVKGWIDAKGKTHEKVWDVACADGEKVDPATQRCPDYEASVNLQDCSLEGDGGATELMAAFRDPDFEAEQAAFYYVRALQNPTCRWSTYDAIRLGIDPDPRVPATIRERVWSSPIWIDP